MPGGSCPPCRTTVLCKLGFRPGPREVLTWVDPGWLFFFLHWGLCSWGELLSTPASVSLSGKGKVSSAQGPSWDWM